MIRPSSNIYISKSKISKAGRGVFAATDIKKNEIIEYCPLFILPREDYPVVKKTALRNYYFMWGKITAAICFGYGSFYNHSYKANATYKKLTKKQAIEFIALRDIKKGEELLVNYNYGNPNSKKKLWIESIKPSNSPLTNKK